MGTVLRLSELYDVWHIFDVDLQECVMQPSDTLQGQHRVLGHLFGKLCVSYQ